MDAPLSASAAGDVATGGFVQRTTSDPVFGAFAITPDDENDLAYPIRGFEVTVAGNVKITCLDDSEITLPARQPGTIYSYAAKRIWATGTTATGIIGVR